MNLNTTIKSMKKFRMTVLALEVRSDRAQILAAERTGSERMIEIDPL